MGYQDLDDDPSAAPDRRRFLRTGLVGGAAVAAAAGIAACTDDGVGSGTTSTEAPEDAVVHGTYTGVMGSDRALPLRKLIEVTDAAAPDNQLTGTHRLIWDVATTAPMVALTIDDGPDPRWTPKVLEALSAAGAKATFFMMGHNIDRHTDLAKEVVAAGHDVGNHTWSHQDLAFMDPPSARREITECKAMLHDLLGSDTGWFRPPRGELSGAALRIASAENYDTVLWSVSRNDPGIGTPEVIARHILERLRPGVIIDMHDSIGRGLFLDPKNKVAQLLSAKRDVDVASMPRILEEGQAAGLRFVTLTELMAGATNPGGLTPSLGRVPRDGPSTVPPAGAH